MEIFNLRTVLVLFWCIQTLHSSIIGNSYNFEYSIDEDGVRIQNSETRRENHTIGSYSVLQPDGMIRDVRYEVNEDEGYHALVTYRPINDRKFLGHLKYPKDFKHPIIEAEPVALISGDLLLHYSGSKKH